MSSLLLKPEKRALNAFGALNATLAAPFSKTTVWPVPIAPNELSVTLPISRI